MQGFSQNPIMAMLANLRRPQIYDGNPFQMAGQQQAEAQVDAVGAPPPAAPPASRTPAEAARLRAIGHQVVNPAEINPDTTMAWAECMRRDIAELVTCDAIRLLPGWESSNGARLEEHIAMRLCMQIILPHQEVA